MGNVYIISAVKAGNPSSQPSIVLQLSSDQQAKKIYRMIKEKLPKAPLGVFGSVYPEKSGRQNKMAPHSYLVHTIADFIHAVRLRDNSRNYIA